jgi:MFS family permease
MPGIAFFANGLWVLVLALLGPSVPSIMEDLRISYTQAGLFFTFLSFGSLLGTSLGAFATDHLNRKRIFIVSTLCLAAGLIVTALSRTYYLIILAIFLMSMLGSPIGAVSQSIMLSLFPQKRERYLSLQTFFAASGSFLSPLIVTAALLLGFPWRAPFLFAAILAIILLVFALRLRLAPMQTRPGEEKQRTARLLKDPALIVSALFIFLSIGPDIGFSYWLTEHFLTDLGAEKRWANAIVTVYLAGVLFGRGILPRILRTHSGVRVIPVAAAIALAGFAGFHFLEPIILKTVCVCVYGMGVAPIFPLLMAWETGRFPGNPGTATGILFGAMSLGGMVFPVLIGRIAERYGIPGGYCLNVAILLFFLAYFGLSARKKRDS